jgi:hypothetical protein
MHATKQLRLESEELEFLRPHMQSLGGSGLQLKIRTDTWSEVAVEVRLNRCS